MSNIVTSRVETFDANGRINLANANFFFLVAVSVGTVVVQLSRQGSVEQISGVQAGLQIARVQRWDWATLTGTPGASCTFFYGYTSQREDITLFSQQIATIAGTPTFILSPNPTTTDTADTAQAAASQTSISANLARRAITIGVPSNALNSVRVSKSGGAARGVEVQPGTSVRFPTTDSMFVRNDDTFGTAASTNWYAEEET